MARIRLTKHLQRFFPGLGEEVHADANTVRELIRVLDAKYPGFGHYVIDEQGAVRKHVNIFVNDMAVLDRTGLSDALGPNDEVFILQALSGG